MGQREHFRLDYSGSDRPTITILGKGYSIINLSEGGCRFAAVGFMLPVGKDVSAIIKFHDGSSETVKGTVLRIEDDRGEVVLNFTTRVPLPKMMEEHRRLIAKQRS